MKSFWVTTPIWVQQLFPKRIWSFPKSSNTVYLTFDDGPIPEVTPWILDQLALYDAKATFFCIGDNIQKHPELFQRIVSEGHAVGNHTFHHLNGRKTRMKPYLENVNLCQNTIQNLQNSTFEIRHSYLFRPPYGRLTSAQSRMLQKKGYHIIMWDLVSYDFHPQTSKEMCLKNVTKNLQPGRIVVFHDSQKAWEKVHHTLPQVLKYISEKNWKCEKIEIEESKV